MDHMKLFSNIFLLPSSTKVISRRKLLNLMDIFLVSLLLLQEQYNHSPLQSSLHPSQGILYLSNVGCTCAHLRQKTRRQAL